MSRPNKRSRVDLLNPQDPDIDHKSAKRIRRTNLLLEARDKIQAHENEFMKRSAIFGLLSLQQDMDREKERYWNKNSTTWNGIVKNGVKCTNNP